MNTGSEVYDEGTKWLSEHGYGHLELVAINQQGNGCLSWSYATADTTKPYPTEKELSDLEAHLKKFSKETKAD